MKTFLKTLWFGLTFGLWFILILGIVYFSIKARQTTDPWLGDDGSTLYTEVGWTLTAAKRNALVAKKWLTDLHSINCTYYSSNAWTVWWKNNTWTVSNCWWTYKPADFTNCVCSSRLVDWSGVQRWLHRCRKNNWEIYLDTANWEVSLWCNYLCRN